MMKIYLLNDIQINIHMDLKMKILKNIKIKDIKGDLLIFIREIIRLKFEHIKYIINFYMSIFI